MAFVNSSLPSSMAELRASGSLYIDGTMSPKSISPYTSPNLRGPSSLLTTRIIDAAGTDGSGSNFPPLHDKPVSHHSRKAIRPPTLAWARQEMPERGRDVFDLGSAPPTSPSSSLSVQLSTPTPAGTLVSSGPGDNDEEYEPPVSPSNDNTSESYCGQDLVIPVTPEFTATSITPVTPKTSLSFPHTPQSNRSGYSAGFDLIHKRDARPTDQDDNRPREVDPLWIFVGGLNTMGALPWDEDRVKAIFMQYGEIDDIQLIMPGEPNRNNYHSMSNVGK
jgi:hypothetical protein